jgi:DNA polymerase I - 3''-5'' exonuclease and polymerase domains
MIKKMINLHVKSKEAYYVPTIQNTSKILNKLKPILENENIKLIGHNLKYDIQILKKYNVNVSVGVDDEYTVNEGDTLVINSIDGVIRKINANSGAVLLGKLSSSTNFRI